MKNLKYILMVLLGGAMYGTMSSFVKLSYAKGFNAAEVAFAQALLAALFLGACALPDLLRKRVSVSAKEAATLALAGIPIGLTNYLYYQSVSLVSASLAIIALMQQFTWVCGFATARGLPGLRLRRQPWYCSERFWRRAFRLPASNPFPLKAWRLRSFPRRLMRHT